MLDDYSSQLEGIHQNFQDMSYSLDSIVKTTSNLKGIHENLDSINHNMKGINKVRKAMLVVGAATLATLIYIDYLIITSV